MDMKNTKNDVTHKTKCKRLLYFQTFQEYLDTPAECKIQPSVVQTSVWEEICSQNSKIYNKNDMLPKQ